MSRETKNIIYWIIIGLLGLVFATTLFIGCVNSIVTPGYKFYFGVAHFINNLGLSVTKTFNYSPFVCILCGSLITFMFYKKFNTRIN